MILLQVDAVTPQQYLLQFYSSALANNLKERRGCSRCETRRKEHACLIHYIGGPHGHHSQNVSTISWSRQGLDTCILLLSLFSFHYLCKSTICYCWLTLSFTFSVICNSTLVSLRSNADLICCYDSQWRCCAIRVTTGFLCISDLAKNAENLTVSIHQNFMCWTSISGCHL